MRSELLLILCFSFSISIMGQTVDTLPEEQQVGFFTPSPEYDKSRFWLLNGGVAVTYSGTLILLNELWYKGYERSSFQFFNDNREWLQMDKAGHLFCAYMLSDWGGGLYRWAGLEPDHAAWAGAISGSLLMSTVEILDGFSAKWGFSIGDFAANTAGSALYLGQELGWNEQRIRPKFSVFPYDYPEGMLRERANQLYGTSIPELVLKDYNALTIWLSGNVSSFTSGNTSIPRWLNLAVGYSGSGMYGGFENRWCTDSRFGPEDCPPEQIIDRTDVPRFRQFFLSADVDLSRIPTNSRALRTIFDIFNVVKFPAPALEVTQQGNVRFHPVYF